MQSKADKSQLVRLADIVLIAPGLLVMSQNKKVPVEYRHSLRLLGWATLFYNATNYLNNSQRY